MCVWRCVYERDVCVEVCVLLQACVRQRYVFVKV